jgi:tRNA nucleotidyltransferase (CCA-adding enzyme)
MLVVRYAAKMGAPVAVRFAALMHDLGKALSPQERWPSHRGHEEAGVPLIIDLCDRLKVPNDFRELAILTARHHASVHRAAELTPGTLLKLLETVDAFRRPERFGELLLACESDARGRTGLEAQPYPQREYLLRVRDAAAVVGLTDDERRELKGPFLGERIRQKRLAAVTAVKETSCPAERPQ